MLKHDVLYLSMHSHLSRGPVETPVAVDDGQVCTRQIGWSEGSEEVAVVDENYFMREQISCKMLVQVRRSVFALIYKQCADHEEISGLPVIDE